MGTLHFNIFGRRFLYLLLWFAIAAIFTWHFSHIYKYTVNIPCWDDWEVFGGNGVILGWDSRFLLRFHNEHRVVPSEILYYLNQHVFNLNFRYQIIFNFFIYAAMSAHFFWILRFRIIQRRSFFLVLGLFPLVTALPIENHTASLQSCMHICLWAFFAGSYLVFTGESWKSYAGFLLWSVSIFSFAYGMAAVCLAWATYLCFFLFNRDRKEFRKLMIGGAIVFLSIFLWMQGYHKNPGHPPYAFPWQPSFLRYFSETLSAGFGFTNVHLGWALLCSVVTFLVFGYFLLYLVRRSSHSREGFLLLAFFLGIMAILALTAFGRSGFPLLQAKTSRYTENTIFIPILLMSFLEFAMAGKWRNIANTALSVLMFVGIYDNFSMQGYRDIMVQRIRGWNCVRRALRQDPMVPPVICETMYPGDISHHLLNVKKLKPSFVHSKSPRE